MRHDYILRNDERTLRPVTLDDAAFIGRLRTQVGTGIVNDTDPDVAVQRRWLEAYFERPGDIYWIIETPGGEPFGTVSLYNLDPATKTMEVGRWLQLPGMRYAYNIYRSMIQIYDFAFGVLGLSRVILDVATHNAHVLRFHRSYGAVETHIEKAKFRFGGKPIDMVWFEITATSWRERIRPDLLRYCG